MGKILIRGYLTGEIVLSLTSFFLVQKVTEEIWMGFDDTVIILNKQLWYSNLIISVVGNLIITVVHDTHMVYFDLGGML